MIELTTHQKRVGEQLKDWWYSKNRRRNYFEIAGAAGTGKSTIINQILSDLNVSKNKMKFATFTGKAALALSRKYCPTKTIHSIFYELDEVETYDERGKPLIYRGRPIMKKVFKKRDQIADLDLIIIDEGSMVSDRMGFDIMSFGIPVITLGDLNQLEPIYGKSYFLQHPDAILTEILRQKAGDPIIEISQMILNGEKLKPHIFSDKCRIISKDSIDKRKYLDYDVIICGKNNTRRELNDTIRYDILKKNSNRITSGDKIIFRKNNWNLAIEDDNVLINIINGLSGYVRNIDLSSYSKSDQSINIDFRPEFTDKYFTDVRIDLKHLYNGQGLINENRSYNNICEWGYAITCHLAQGSQYKNVFVYDEKFGYGDFHKRWLYTAVTRAEEALTIAISA
jgi:exodeoxyribonuclease-5